MKANGSSIVRKAICMAAGLLLGTAAVSAFTFEPMSVSFDSEGAGSVRTFRVRNDGKERIPVRIRVLTREASETGVESNGTVPEGLFVVFPSRFVIDPGSTRSLKVQWKGSAPRDRELSFRIVAEQVPVEFQARQGSGISLLFKYVGALYVRSPSVAPDAVRVVSAVGAEKEGLGRGIVLRVRNEGGIHAIMLDCSLSISSTSGQSFVLPKESLSSVEGTNMLADGDRVFFVPFGKAELGASYEARLAFTAER